MLDIIIQFLTNSNQKLFGKLKVDITYFEITNWPLWFLIG